LIVLEGNEGVGKTTQLEKVSAYLREQGKEVISPREPGGTPEGELIRSCLKHPDNHWLSSSRELVLFNAARAILVGRVIEPALAAGIWVAVDRYYPSTIAYQGFAGKYSPIMELHHQIRDAIGDTRPDLTCILDAPVEVSIQRKNHEHATDRFQQKGAAYMEAVRDGYFWYAGDRILYRENKILLDTASFGIEEVFHEIKKEIDNLLQVP